MGLDCLTLQFLRGDEPVMTRRREERKREKENFYHQRTDSIDIYLPLKDATCTERLAASRVCRTDRLGIGRGLGVPIASGCQSAFPDLSSPASGSPFRRPTRRLFAVQNFPLIAPSARNLSGSSSLGYAVNTVARQIYFFLSACRRDYMKDSTKLRPSREYVKILLVDRHSTSADR